MEIGERDEGPYSQFTIFFGGLSDRSISIGRDLQVEILLPDFASETQNTFP
jgi:hypothetical protein